MDENSSSKRSKKEKKAKKEKKEKKPSLVRQTSGFLKKQIVDLKEAVADTADLLKKPSSARQLPPPLRLPPESPSSSSRSPPDSCSPQPSCHAIVREDRSFHAESARPRRRSVVYFFFCGRSSEGSQRTAGSAFQQDERSTRRNALFPSILSVTTRSNWC